MEKITSVEQLRERIKNLEMDREYKLEMLKLQFNEVMESIKPANIIKNKISDAISPSNIKNTLINAAIGLAAGFISKKVLVGVVANPIKKILGNVIQFGVAGMITKNGTQIRNAGVNLFRKFFPEKEEA